jgi:hypothetical protein
VDEAAYEAAREAYRVGRSNIEAEFKRDLFDEHGVTDNVKAEKAYSIANEERSGEGYEKIADYFDTLVVLIK